MKGLKVRFAVTYHYSFQACKTIEKTGGIEIFESTFCRFSETWESVILDCVWHTIANQINRNGLITLWRDINPVLHSELMFEDYINIEQ